MKEFFSKYLLLISVAFFSLCFASVLRAKDFYIAQTSAGTGTGSSADNAAAVTFFNTAGNWGSGTAKISPGDTVHLVGTISTTLTVQASGSSGSPITLLFESGAKLSKSYWGVDSAAAIYASGKNYIVVDGNSTGVIECTANGDTLANSQSSHGISLYSCSNWEIKGLTIQNIYTHTNGTTNSVSTYTTRGVSGYDCSSMSVHDNIINGAYVAVIEETASAAAFSAISIYQNTITNTSTGIIVALGTTSSSYNGVNIYKNDITMGTNWFDPDDYNHIDGIHCWGTTGGSISNTKIYDNYVHGDCSTHCTGFIFLESTIIAPVIYNNMLVATNNKPAEAFIDLSQEGNIGASIYNNTIVGLGTTSSGGIGITVYAWSTNNVTVMNNILSSLFYGYYEPQSGVTRTLNYNIYYNVGNVARIVSTAYSTLATWQKAYGCDANSATATPNLSATYYVPSGASSAIASGTDLSSFFTTDLTGATRAIWDCGAVIAGTASWKTGAASGTISVTAPSNATTSISVQ